MAWKGAKETIPVARMEIDMLTSPCAPVLAAWFSAVCFGTDMVLFPQKGVS